MDEGGAARLRPFLVPHTPVTSEKVAHPSCGFGVKLRPRFEGMERQMSFVRLYPDHRRRRLSRTSLVILGLSAWLALGLLSQAAFQLIG